RGAALQGLAETSHSTVGSESWGRLVAATSPALDPHPLPIAPKLHPTPASSSPLTDVVNLLTRRSPGNTGHKCFSGIATASSVASGQDSHHGIVAANAAGPGVSLGAGLSVVARTRGGPADCLGLTYSQQAPEHPIRQLFVIHSLLQFGVDDEPQNGRC